MHRAGRSGFLGHPGGPQWCRREALHLLELPCLHPAKPLILRNLAYFEGPRKSS